MTRDAATPEIPLAMTTGRGIVLNDGGIRRAGETIGGALQSLTRARPLYMLPTDPIAEEVLIPGFQSATSVDCMVGFFSSDVLASLAPGLATYIARVENSLRLIISPLLTVEDKKAIEEGLKSAEEAAYRVLDELIVTEDLLQRHTLQCLSWLLKERRIEIRVALMKGALFHPKVWLFGQGEDIVAAHGSSNVTLAGIRKNIEQIAVSRSWQDPNQKYITDKLRYQFSRLWEDRDDNCIVVDLPRAVKDRLLTTYNSEVPPTEDELRDLFQRASGGTEDSDLQTPLRLLPQRLEVPPGLRYEDGPFAHQGKAVEAWCESGYRGVLEMATGSGKTIASIIGACRLYQQHKPLFVVVAAPYIPLIIQWCDEITPFNVQPVNLAASGGGTERKRVLQRLHRRLRTGVSDVEVAVVSHDTLCTVEFFESVAKFECKTLLIADEVHNLGRLSFINRPPSFFNYRLGISATPIRQYDDEGTRALFDFFGPIVFRYSLEEAIGSCLVEYDYHVHPVELTDSEMDEWYDLTATIKQNAWRRDDGTADDYLARLLRDRRALLETASGKIAALAAILDNEDTGSLRYTLVYASDKGPDQLKQINRVIRNRHLLFHQITAHETTTPRHLRTIIDAFQQGDIQVLTAKRVLDEGVDLPEICRAFILASTTVERQWVQRRGRLLRRCPSVGKTHSVIHDFLAIPPKSVSSLDRDARSLLRSELRRVQEFARLARNAGRPEGPLTTIDRLVRAAYL